MKSFMARAMGCVVLLLMAAGSAGVSPTVASAPQPLKLVEVIDTGGTPGSIVVDCWAGRNDVVFRDGSKVRYLDGNTLVLAPEEHHIPSWGFSTDLVYDRFHHQTYALQVILQPGWSEVMVHALRGRSTLASFSANGSFNTPTPQDKFYSIDGVAYRQPTTEGSEYGRLIIDDTANGTINVVDINNVGTDAASRYRHSYGASLCGTSYCGHYSNKGNSLALETNRETAPVDDLGTSDLLYIADQNRQNPAGPYKPGYVRVLEISHPPLLPSPAALPHVDLTGQWPFGNGNQGLAMAGPRDRLYVASGMQSFNDGYVGVVDTRDNSLEQVIGLTYADRYFVHVDWYDPKRVFVATFDDFYNDPHQGLYLHLIYDDTVVATLMLKAAWDQYAEEVRGMAFDPYHRRLYITVGSHIMVVKVNYGAPAPPATAEGTIDATGGTVATPGGGAVLEFPAGAVAQDTVVSYAEIGRMPSGEYAGVRFFDLTAELAAGGTPVTAFGEDYELRLAYMDDELGGAIESTLGLFYWDGAAWVEVSSTLDEANNRLTASLDHMTSFAILGETNRIFLPVGMRRQ